jgi:hypothetical protein
MLAEMFDEHRPLTGTDRLQNGCFSAFLSERVVTLDTDVDFGSSIPVLMSLISVPVVTIRG